jgi:hypothetical protein
MKSIQKILPVLFVLCLAAFGQEMEYETGRQMGQQRGPLGLGYDEGIACRFFFSERIGIQGSIGFEQQGEYNGNESETDFSIGGAFLFTILGTQYIYLDAVGQVAFAHDDTNAPNDAGDRNLGFFRAALAPEILIGNHLGLGFRFGLELASLGERKNQAGQDLNDDQINIRFFAPDNPFTGGTFGMSLFVYLGS